MTPAAPRRAHAVHFSSAHAEHDTPPVLLAAVVRCLGAIDLDPCSPAGRPPPVPAARHYTVAEDGLSREWRGRVYMNPPYGRAIAGWVAKLGAEHAAGRVTQAIALVPARPDTRWFALLREAPCCFVRGRVTFIGNADPAPFPSAVFYLGPAVGAFCTAFADLGDIWRRVAGPAGVHGPRTGAIP